MQHVLAANLEVIKAGVVSIVEHLFELNQVSAILAAVQYDEWRGHVVGGSIFILQCITERHHVSWRIVCGVHGWVQLV